MPEVTLHLPDGTRAILRHVSRRQLRELDRIRECDRIDLADRMLQLQQPAASTAHPAEAV